MNIGFNPLEQFIDKHQDKDWDWGHTDGLSFRVSSEFSMEFIEKHIDKPWNWGYNGLSAYANVTVEFVEKHIDKPWAWNSFLYNKHIPLGLFLDKFKDKPWNWNYLSGSPFITNEMIEQHLDKPWDWGSGGLSRNPNISPEFIERHLDKPWAWYVILQYNKKITPAFVDKYINKFVENINVFPDVFTEAFIFSKQDISDYIGTNHLHRVSFYKLSMYYNISEYLIEKYIDKPWNWGIGGLSMNLNITPEFVERNLDKPWAWGYDGLSRNPNMTMEFIERHRDKPWAMSGLSMNPNITVEFIKSHQQQRNWSLYNVVWSTKHITNELVDYCIEEICRNQNTDKSKEIYRLLSTNYNLTQEFIEQNIDKPWDWKKLSRARCITIDFIERHIDKPWDWKNMEFIKGVIIEYPYNNKNYQYNPKMYMLSDGYIKREFICNKYNVTGWKEYVRIRHLDIVREILLNKLKGHECVKYNIVSYLI
jgi:hypothetical protein